MGLFLCQGNDRNEFLEGLARDHDSRESDIQRMPHRFVRFGSDNVNTARALRFQFHNYLHIGITISISVSHIDR